MSALTEWQAELNRLYGDYVKVIDRAQYEYQVNTGLADQAWQRALALGAKAYSDIAGPALAEYLNAMAAAAAAQDAIVKPAADAYQRMLDRAQLVHDDTLTPATAQYQRALGNLQDAYNKATSEPTAPGMATPAATAAVPANLLM